MSDLIAAIVVGFVVVCWFGACFYFNTWRSWFPGQRVVAQYHNGLEIVQVGEDGRIRHYWDDSFGGKGPWSAWRWPGERQQEEVRRRLGEREEG